MEKLKKMKDDEEMKECTFSPHIGKSRQVRPASFEVTIRQFEKSKQIRNISHIATLFDQTEKNCRFSPQFTPL